MTRRTELNMRHTSFESASGAAARLASGRALTVTRDCREMEFSSAYRRSDHTRLTRLREVAESSERSLEEIDVASPTPYASSPRSTAVDEYEEEASDYGESGSFSEGLNSDGDCYSYHGTMPTTPAAVMSWTRTTTTMWMCNLRRHDQE